MHGEVCTLAPRATARAAAAPTRDADGRPGGGAARACRPHPAPARPPRRLRRRPPRRAVAGRPPRPAARLRPELRLEHRRRHRPAHRADRPATSPSARCPSTSTPSWDLRTLWVTNDLGNSLTPIDPRTGRPGRPVPVADPYNLYFTADGRRAIVVAEAHRELDFRTPHTMRLTHAPAHAGCAGRRPHGLHGRRPPRARLVRVRRPHDRRRPAARARRADDRAAPPARCRRTSSSRPTGARSTSPTWRPAASGSIDAHRLRVDRLPARPGAGAHGLYPSRDSRDLYVSNRGEGTISVISFRTRRAGRASGASRAAARRTWAASRPTAACSGSRGRYDGEVYAISHPDRAPAAPHPGRPRPARDVRLAAARPLLDRPHRHPALTAGSCRRPPRGRAQAAFRLSSAGVRHPAVVRPRFRMRPSTTTTPAGRHRPARGCSTTSGR